MTENKLNRLRTKCALSLIIGSVFFYFLIFAQFGFLHRLNELEGDAYLNGMALLSMGLGGIIGCVIAARCFEYRQAKSWLMAGFIGCGLAATTIAALPQILINIAAGFWVGLSLGILTVCVVPIIAKRLAGDKLGLWTACGVGGAYALCNVPWIFNSSPVDHCILAGAACVLGVVLSNYLPKLSEASPPDDASNYKTPETLYLKSGLVLMTALFLVLIWLDSAVFTIIQGNGAVKAAVWSEPGQLWTLASVHFVAALAAGWFLDKGWILPSLVAAAGFLTVEAWTLSHPSALGGSYATYFYVTAVSIYSTCLVAYGALAPEKRNLPKIQVRTAWVFAIGGWVGSGLGIGMARELNTVPAYFLIGAMATAGISLAGIRILKQAGDKSPTPAH